MYIDTFLCVYVHTYECCDNENNGYSYGGRYLYRTFYYNYFLCITQYILSSFYLLQSYSKSGRRITLLSTHT